LRQMYAAVVLAVMSSACAETGLLEPAAVEQSVAQIQPASVVADVPALRVTGGMDCGQPLPDVLSWELQIAKRSTPLHLRVLAFHSRTAGCGATTERGVTSIVKIDGPLDVATGEAATTRFSIRTDEFNCGRVQFDVGGYEGAEVFGIIGAVFTYGKDCAAPPVVQLPPVVPPPLTLVTPGDCRTALRDVDFSRIGPSSARLVFRIAPGYGNVQLSLVSFIVTDGVFLPQTFYAAVTGQFDAGGVYALTVPMPPGPFWQADALCGPPLRGDLTAGNFNAIDARTFAWLWPGGAGGNF